MVSEVDRAEGLEYSEKSFSNPKVELNAFDAWKVVGSPARRASVTLDKRTFNEGFSINRTKSISGFEFQSEGSAPPPGLSVDGKEGKNAEQWTQASMRTTDYANNNLSVVNIS
jgi:hypothetical protein